ncbi:uncharacterized protein FOBCDRAFT_197464 [Fusarium oxysporum Fo47]|nr:uncharacterized protein FOBCDRAFT_197464 [Fusarium oxysporum Fo47]QKD50052.2 hypothetical protein FOBCDRAFT_197464 [Fusarium oxysporum Fo47]
MRTPRLTVPEDRLWLLTSIVEVWLVLYLLESSRLRASTRKLKHLACPHFLACSLLIATLHSRTFACRNKVHLIFTILPTPDSELDSPLLVPTTEFIETSRLKTSTEEGNNCVPPVNPGSESSTPQNHSQRERRCMPLSPEKELRNMSSGIMPGSWDAESPSTTKTHEYYERDIGTRKEENLQLHHHLVEDLLQRLSELNGNKQIADEKADRLTKKVSHIFSLQPYRKDLTPEEVGQDYDALVEQIQDWVQKLVNPWLEDCDDDAHAFLTHAKRRKADANRFKSVLKKEKRKIPGSYEWSEFPRD